ncbi:MAG: mechanosensitive ion channel [Acidobacteriota bacterium]|nr:MAG: mechanosensitive ion channel [Acidobacteriota bacterium]
MLGLFGIPTTSFIAVLGAAGLAVGLALQGTLSYLAADVMLLVFRPFRVGDYVEIAGAEGSVDEVGVFTTSLDTLQNVHIVVPNSAVWGATIKSFTKNEVRRNDITIGISYGDDIGRAIGPIKRTLASDPRVLKGPEPLVAVSDLGESSVDILVGPDCTPGDYWALRFDLIRSIEENLEADGCTIPFPQRGVHSYPTSAPSPAA